MHHAGCFDQSQKTFDCLTIRFYYNSEDNDPIIYAFYMHKVIKTVMFQGDVQFVELY